MNIKTETENENDNDYYDVTKKSDEILHSISCTPLIIDTKVEIDSELNEAENYFCSVCGKTFDTCSSLDKHTAKHIGK